VETKGDIAHFAAVGNNVSILLEWQFRLPKRSQPEGSICRRFGVKGQRYVSSS
jgi:hypothetical protein